MADLEAGLDVALGARSAEIDSHNAPGPVGRTDHHDGHDQQDQGEGDSGVGVRLALEVDLQGQRAIAALQAPGEGDGGPELAQRTGEREHCARGQARHHEGQRDPAEHAGRRGAEGRRHHLVRSPAVRSAPSRLTTRNGSATKVCAITTAMVEKAIWTQGRRATRRAARAAEGVEQGQAAHHRGQHEGEQDQGTSTPRSRNPDRASTSHGTPTTMQANVLATRRTQAQPEAPPWSPRR